MRTLIPVALLLCGMGCTAARSYITPGPAADLSRLAPPDLGKLLAREPAARFPAHLAVIRVQGHGYRSHTTRGWGMGGFTVVTTRDVETEEDFERVGNWSGVAGVGRLNRLLLPAQIGTEKDLRRAAAQIHADLILLYTFDTRFEVEKRLRPAAVLTLGLLPNRRAHVHTTASAVVLDTRSGFVYGTAEATAKEEKRANAWSSSQAVDDARKKAERAALDELFDELESMWPRVLLRGSQPAGNRYTTD